MRRRLVITYLALLALILLALEVPLASTAASRGTDEMVLDRLVDANRYASTADAALRDGDTADLSAGLTRYHDLYGISAAVVDRDGRFVVVTGERTAFDAPAVRSLLAQALAGERAGGDRVVWPWQPAYLTLAVPVTSAGEVIGAVVTRSPTDRLRGAEVRALGFAGGTGLVALLAFVAVAVGLARWTPG